jgi:hypothetical protein
MDAVAFRAIRAKIAEPDIVLANRLGILVSELDELAAGSRPISRLQARRLHYCLAIAERKAALAAAGLDVCPWIQRWNEAEVSSEPDALIAHAQSAEAHAQTCPQCQRREQFVLERFGPMPAYPQGIWESLLEIPLALPTWAQPAAFGAAVLVGIVALRLLIAGMGSSTFSGAEALRALAAAALGGAAGGVAYSLTRPTLRKLGTLGAYLTGVVCVIAYGGSLVAVAPIAFGETLIEDRVSLFAFLVMAVLFGLILGHQLFRDVES